MTHSWLVRIGKLISINPGAWAVEADQGTWLRMKAVEAAFARFADEVTADIPMTKAQRMAAILIRERILDELERDATTIGMMGPHV